MSQRISMALAQPFARVVNAKTEKLLGIKIPNSVLLRADTVI